MRVTRSRIGIVEALEDRCLLAAQLVRDIDPRTAGSPLSISADLGNQAIFWNSNELWRTDGSGGGLRRLFTAGTAATSDNCIVSLNGRGFFTAKTSSTSSKFSLWTTDGSVAGTSKVADLDVVNLSVCGNMMYAGVRSATSTLGELWKCDGTVAGTQLIRQFSSEEPPSEMTAFGGSVFFAAADTFGDRELWKTDGTNAGTSRVLDINPGANESSPTKLTVSNGILYFAASTSTTGNQPWRSDGTAAGTFMLSNVFTSWSSWPEGFVPLDSQFTLFIANDYLWKTNGTIAGTSRMLPLGQGPSSFGNLVRAAGKIYFTASQSSSGVELWRTDGTVNGTVQLTDINPTGSSFPGGLTAVGNTLCFTAFSTPYLDSSGLWKTDGTVAGTVNVRQMKSLGVLSTIAHDKLLFCGDDGLHGIEPWVSDGTVVGTALLSDMTLSPLDSNPGGAFPSSNYWPYRGLVGSATIGDVTYFSANQEELWRSDGTEQGTWLVRRIPRRVGSSNNPTPIRHLTAWNNKVYFTAGSPDADSVWCSDGTETGTMQLALVTDVNPERALFVPFGSWLYFFDDDKLCRTNGTVAGTSVIKSGLWSPEDLVATSQKIYFVDRSTSDWTVWVSNGTAAGTVTVRSLVPNVIFYHPAELTAVNDSVFFTAEKSSFSDARTLYVTDGTTAGTRELAVGRVDASRPGYSDYLSPFLTSFQGFVYFAGSSSDSTTNLWRSDGTVAGTQQVKKLGTLFEFPHPEWFTVSGNRLYFVSHLAANGWELWVSDGTDAGTKFLKDINPGVASAFQVWDQDGVSEWPIMPGPNGTAFFEADDGSSGVELWQTAGSPATTRRVADLYPGLVGSNARPMSVINPPGSTQPILLFSATDPVHGRELWSVSADAVPPSFVSSSFAYAGTRATITFTFDELIATDVDVSAVSVVDALTNNAIAGSQIRVVVQDNTLQVQLDEANGFRAGVYSVSLNGSAVRDVAGNPSLSSISPIRVAVVGAAQVATVPERFGLLRVDWIALAANGVFDLTDNDLVVTRTGRSTLESYIRTAYNFGGWDGAGGIFSSTAKNNPLGNTTLGLLSGTEFNDNSGGLFNGQAVANSDVLVKYTYFGDIDFNGQVDVSDYNLIDFGFSNHLTGWAFGDADWSGGATDVSDYNLIDFAFATQTGAL